jgi:hypothetical protein
MVMFWRRRNRSAACGPTPSPAHAAAQALRNAEEFVRAAWELELLRQRDDLRFAVRSAHEDRDAAGRALAEAQRDGDPRKIAAAHHDLEAVLGAVRNSEINSDHRLRMLRAELDLLNRTSKEHAVAALVRQLEHDGAAVTAPPASSQWAPIRQMRTILVMQRPKPPRARWVARLRLRRTADPGQP